MLEDDDRSDTAAQLIAALPCHVELPAQLRDNFEKRGFSPAANGERRRYPRIFCRSQHNRAAMQFQPTLPRLEREPGWQSVYVTNVSRDGLGLLHSEPLYPQERLRLLMITGRMVQAEVVGCRRVHTRCFEIGTRLVGDDPKQQPTSTT